MWRMRCGSRSAGVKTKVGHPKGFQCFGFFCYSIDVNSCVGLLPCALTKSGVFSPKFHVRFDPEFTTAPYLKIKSSWQYIASFIRGGTKPNRDSRQKRRNQITPELPLRQKPQSVTNSVQPHQEGEEVKYTHNTTTTSISRPASSQLKLRSQLGGHRTARGRYRTANKTRDIRGQSKHFFPTPF